MEKKVAIYPGSFDPFTLGHKNIVEQSLRMFDKVVIAIGENSQKRSFLSIAKREELIKLCFSGNTNVEVVSYKGLTADYCRKHQINFIIRGIRNVGDFEFERGIASLNKRLNPELDSIFLMTPIEFSDISSTAVREIINNNGDASMFLPSEIVEPILIAVSERDC